MKTITPKGNKGTIARLAIGKERRRQTGIVRPVKGEHAFSLESVSFRLNGSFDCTAWSVLFQQYAIRSQAQGLTFLAGNGELPDPVPPQLTYAEGFVPGCSISYQTRRKGGEEHLTAATPTVSPIITHLCKRVVMRVVNPNYIILAPTGRAQIGIEYARSMPTDENTNFEAQCGAICIKMYR
jgi:hypothetical protein